MTPPAIKHTHAHALSGLHRGVSASAPLVSPIAATMLSLPRTTPEDGDIVVREEQRNGTLLYVLHTAPGADQYVLRSRADAVAQGVALAKRQHIRAWLTDEGYEFVLLEDYREIASTSSARTHLYERGIASWRMTDLFEEDWSA